MELKQTGQLRRVFANVLLIVPYGIETRHRLRVYNSHHLLIVPYGIETIIVYSRFQYFPRLLIVPYGIETIFGRCGRFQYHHF